MKLIKLFFSKRFDLIHRIIKLEAALTAAAETFERYEKLHRAKGTPESNVKADVNRDLAKMCRGAMAGWTP